MKSIVSLIVIALFLSSCGKISYSLKKNKDDFEIEIEGHYEEDEIEEIEECDHIPEPDQIKEGETLSE